MTYSGVGRGIDTTGEIEGMTRSRQRKLRKIQARNNSRSTWRALPVASALLACMHPAQSAENSETATLEEVVVTAQKRTENLQDVAISIQAIGTAKLEERGIRSRVRGDGRIDGIGRV